MNPAEALAQSLTNDRPTIDSAIKSFMSLTAARNWSTSDPNIQAATRSEYVKDSLQNAICSEEHKERCFFVKSKNARMAALLCARSLLKKINSFHAPTENEEKDESKVLEFEVVRILWNGLVDSGKKPSMIVGKQALCHLYPLILESLIDEAPAGVDAEEARTFMEEFGRLLNGAMKRRDTSISKEEKEKMDSQDDDSCLLWDTDGGAAELKRRRDRRENNVNAVKMSFDENGNREFVSATEGMTIEEIEEEEEEEGEGGEDK